jgi:DNA-binding response OmpR family regulator
MHISIIDDETILGTKIKKKLEIEWYAVSIFFSFSDFMTHGDARSQLYIIDISLGDGSGIDIISWLRNKAECTSPIMIISGYGDSEKIVYGLNTGADDYVTKPIIPNELIARVRALLRRPSNFVPHSVLQHKSIIFSPDSQETKVSGTKIYLTHKESMILEFFLKEQWQIVSRGKLINAIWWAHNLSDVSDNTINVTLSKLRKKIWADFHLKTIYNQWYVLE